MRPVKRFDAGALTRKAETAPAYQPDLGRGDIMAPVRSLQISVALVLALGACNVGEVDVYDLPAPAAVALTMTLRAEEGVGAEVLGWPERRLPEALVRLDRVESEIPWSAQDTTDASGTVTFSEVPPGSYRLEVSRLLTESERDRARASGAVAFVHAGTIALNTATNTRDLVVPASRMRSLVFSEIRSNVDRTTSGGYYYFGMYVELYNNADTTVYLDGKVIGLGFNLLRDYSPNRPCSMFDRLRTDSRGVWALVFEQFPGTGRTYPLAPGKAVVVAHDAIDHRPFAPSALDLSSADFESRGPGDVDNPAVPNMVDIGLMPDTPRGLRFRDGTVFIAEPVVTDQLQRDREPDSGREWALIPADRILDVVVHTYDAGFEGITFPLCQTVSNPLFDRAWVHVLPERDVGRSLHRRPLRTLAGERVVLQHTRSSFADFIAGPVSPGSTSTQR